MQDRLESYFSQVVEGNSKDRILLEEINHTSHLPGTLQGEIEKTMGSEFFHKYTDAEYYYSHMEGYSAFLEGVCLGFQVAFASFRQEPLNPPSP